MTHICIGKMTIMGPNNGLSPGRCQAIIWTNAGRLLIGPSGTNFSEILIEIIIFPSNKIHLKVSSAKRRPFCLGLNVLKPSSWFRPAQCFINCLQMIQSIWPIWHGNENSLTTWWRHQMGTLFELLHLCEGNPPVISGLPSHRPETPSFHIFFKLRPNKRLSKQPIRRWFEQPSRSLWHHSNEITL